MTEINEALKGFTDLPIALLAAVLGVLALRKGSRKGYGAFFLLTAAAAALGSVAHIFRFPPVTLKLLWVILYALLFEALRRFTLLFTGYILGTDITEKPCVYAAEAVCYLGAAVLTVTLYEYDMLCLVVFAVLMLGRVAAAVIKRKGLAPRGIVLLSFLPVLALLQGFSDFIPYAVIIEHILIVAAMAVFYSTRGKSD